MNPKDFNNWINVFKKSPVSTALGILVLAVGSGASVGALATKGMVDEKHSEAMNRINLVERDQQRSQDQLNRMEDKLDRVIEKLH